MQKYFVNIFARVSVKNLDIFPDIFSIFSIFPLEPKFFFSIIKKYVLDHYASLYMHSEKL